MRTIILCILLLLPSCTFLRKAEETLDKANEVYTNVKAEVANVKAELEKADTNKDGKVDGNELFWWLTTGGGLAFIIATIKKALDLKKDRAEHRAETEDLAAKLAALEAKVKP